MYHNAFEGPPNLFYNQLYEEVIEHLEDICITSNDTMRDCNEKDIISDLISFNCSDSTYNDSDVCDSYVLECDLHNKGCVGPYLG